MAFPLSPLSVNYGHILLPTRLETAAEERDDATNSTLPVEDGAPPRKSAFSGAVGAAPDPILSIRDAFLADGSEAKLNLAVGVYRTAEGHPYVLPSVKLAEQKLLDDLMCGTADKEYLPPDGLQPFCEASLQLLLGNTTDPSRVVAAQSLSGTGALHLAARVIAEMIPGATVYLPQPTWPIHADIFGTVGLRVAYYPYYDPHTCGLRAAEMIAALRSLPKGGVVLLHACAHNPTGVDPTPQHWEAVADVLHERRLIPLIDSAYQGLASGDLWQDGAGARTIAARGGEMLICQSFSKNMGLYGERAGVFSMLCSDAVVASRVREQLKRIIRVTYSSPPRHGAALACRVLCERELRDAWTAEVAGMAARLLEMRTVLFAALERVRCPPPHGTDLKSWSHVLTQRGMFTYTGLRPEQVLTLREEHHIYMPMDGRISMAGLSVESCDKLAKAINAALRCGTNEEAGGTSGASSELCSQSKRARV
ncbi:hypothetical protein AB1Y20_000631 [Prymnesium parvum]|uniref:Aspartate aminotransferase n=1 Tax=Prymnesium parvum TaxID=97485 RepID=A0AB34K8P0_PRYPA